MSDPQELAIKALELTDRQDWAGREALMTPDCEWSMPSAVLRGPEAATAFSRPFVGAFPDSKHTIDLIAGDGDVVVVEGTWVGTHLGPLPTPTGDIPATGQAVRLPFGMIARVRHGLIASMHVYYDQLGFLAQLGLVPQPQAV
jgi:ketosteroid isomerase-like protein